MTSVGGLGIIALAIWAIMRRVDVRLALMLAAGALALVAGASAALPHAWGWSWARAGQEFVEPPTVILRTFLTTLTREQFVVPICCAMGFAHVLRLTQCDQHLVQLLVRPLRHARSFLVPGAVVVGFLVNIPVISQTSTAVAIGAVLVPLLLAARISPVTTGAALLLGSSIGGELLNPGAPELRTVTAATGISSEECVANNLPLVLFALGVAIASFWPLSLWADARQERTGEVGTGAASGPEAVGSQPSVGSGHSEDLSRHEEASPAEPPPMRINGFKAAVPLLPLALLFLTGQPLQVVVIPRHWLVEATNSSAFDSRLIGLAMLLGTIVAGLTSRQTVFRSAQAFFEGAGYAYANIISLIVVASCFGEAVKLVGLARFIGQFAAMWPASLLPLAGALPLALAWLSGSGMAATQSLFEFFVEPAHQAGINPARLGSIVSIGAAAGRTMSPAAAVTLMCASLTETNPLDLVRRVALPLVLGVAAVVLVCMLRQAIG